MYLSVRFPHSYVYKESSNHLMQIKARDQKQTEKSGTERKKLISKDYLYKLVHTYIYISNGKEVFYHKSSLMTSKEGPSIIL